MSLRKALIAIVASAATLSVVAGNIKWTSADELPLLGKCVPDKTTSLRYQRLPDSLEHIIKRFGLFQLGKNSAGMAIRFRSDAPAIHAKWKPVYGNQMDHQTLTGTRGLDLYIMQPDSTWTFANSGRPSPFTLTTEACIIQNMTPVMREYMLYLSLYDGVDSLYIGVDNGYSVQAPQVNLPAAANPIIYYGTSLTQGGCSSRAGMAHTNILQRRLNRDIVNLGFSGNGQLDLEIAQVMAAVPDPALYVLDFVPNVTYEQVDTLLNPFVETLRAAHPLTPILIIEDPDYPFKRFDTAAFKKVEQRRVLLHEKVDALRANDPNIHFLPSKGLTGCDNEETVDGLHFTDIGFLRYANSLEPLLRSLIKQ